jgi:uncharacterized BrkB/YihY/UPF0761 family membrane protein
MVPLGSLTQVLVFKLQQVTPAQSVVMMNVYVKYADHVPSQGLLFVLTIVGLASSALAMGNCISGCG